MYKVRITKIKDQKIISEEIKTRLLDFDYSMNYFLMECIKHELPFEDLGNNVISFMNLKHETIVMELVS